MPDGDDDRGRAVGLYTDGLVEQGHTRLDDGIATLTEAAELHEQPLDEQCDQLLDRFLTGHGDDDVALLAVRCHPQSSRATRPQ